MRQVDAYLSRKAQAAWPTAVVWKESDGQDTGKELVMKFVLERKDMEPVVLGAGFPESRAGLYVLISAAKAGEKASEDK